MRKAEEWADELDSLLSHRGFNVQEADTPSFIAFINRVKSDAIKACKEKCKPIYDDWEASYLEGDYQAAGGVDALNECLQAIEDLLPKD